MTSPLRVLALNAFHGGSHRAFLSQWSSRSRYEWTLLTLPGRKWKWRMRHAAITLAEEAADRVSQGQSFDVLFCTDMLNLAEFLGLCPPAIRELPRVAYFHENQLTYPRRTSDDRDLHFAFTNLTTALAASEVWFNSAFHRDEFFEGFADWLPRLPDFQPLSALEEIRNKSAVRSPGVQATDSPVSQSPGEPLTILWASRWEHDKNPELFFEGLKAFQKGGRPFRLKVLGESYSQAPSCFEAARTAFAEQIDTWGFLPERADYESVLAASDVVVSTADHEFFGIAILEAVAAGCFPLTPCRLAYPEVLGTDLPIFHDDSSQGIADRLTELVEWKADGRLQDLSAQLANRVRTNYGWAAVAPRLDNDLARLADAVE